MDAGPASALSPVVFEDGLGQRRQMVGAGNQPLSVLILDEKLTAVSSFESALRERIGQLAGFQHRSFARVRGIAHLANTPSSPALASDHVAGVRLSEILAVAEQRLIPLEIDAALCLIRQLVPAVAAMHENVPGACHGALAPERIIITPDARVVIVEHVLGAALEQLRFSHERYWKELRIPLPLTGGPPRFDRRADVTQLGALALALILGRPLVDDEYAARIADIVQSARAISATGLELLPAGVHSWLRRALQLDSRRSFASTVEALVELDGIDDADSNKAQQALESFLAQCYAARVPSGAKPSGSAISGIFPPPKIDPSPELRVAGPAVTADKPTPIRLAPGAARFEPPAWTEGEDVDTRSQETSEETEIHMQNRTASRRGRWIAAAVVLIALASGGTLAARRYLGPPPTGTLVVNTTPSGVSVAIDGQQRGSTPLTVDLTPGNHVLEVATGGQLRTIPVTITDGGQVAQFIELSDVTPASVVGQLHVRTDPVGASVVVDGQPRGVSPLTLVDLTPGVHTVTLEAALGSVTEQVTIEAGATASLIVPLTGPPGAPVSGWISVAAPVDVQVYENKRLLGSSRSDRIMVSAGRHELEIANEALGYRASRVVQVTPGNVSPIRLDWPKGSMALNALPWADVWVDGERLGETPIGNVLVPIGPHEIVFRHPELGEQAHKVTITLTAPARVSADLRKR